MTPDLFHVYTPEIPKGNSSSNHHFSRAMLNFGGVFQCNLRRSHVHHESGQCQCKGHEAQRDADPRGVGGTEKLESLENRQNLYLQILAGGFKDFLCSPLYLGK